MTFRPKVYESKDFADLIEENPFPFGVNRNSTMFKCHTENVDTVSRVFHKRMNKKKMLQISFYI